MPGVDMTQALHNPLTTSTFTVVRRKEVVSTTGRTKVQPEEFKGVYGLITSVDPTKVRRDPEATIPEKTVMVITRFALRDSVGGFQPDIIYWHGNYYLCGAVQDYSEFASGFVSCTADIYNYVGYAPQVNKVPS